MRIAIFAVRESDSRELGELASKIALERERPVASVGGEIDENEYFSQSAIDELLKLLKKEIVDKLFFDPRANLKNTRIDVIRDLLRKVAELPDDKLMEFANRLDSSQTSPGMLSMKALLTMLDMGVR